MTRKKVLIIDSLGALIWRAYGQAPLTYQEKRIEIISIGLAILRKYIEQFEPDHCVLIWDGGHDKTRVKRYPAYKKKRKELTEVQKKERKVMFNQAKELTEVLKYFPVFQYRLLDPPREADDVIYNIIRLRKEHEFVVVSSDRDMFQLFASFDNLKLYSPHRDVIFTKQDAEKEFGFSMANYVFYQGLVGDPSDNLSGIPGIGPAKAKKLFAMLEGKEKPDEKLIDLFESNIDSFNLTCDLVRFKEIELDEINHGEILPQERPERYSDLCIEVIKWLQKFGFKKYIDDFERWFKPFEILWKRNI